MSANRLVEARECYARRRWREAYAHYQTAAAEVALDLDDMEQFAIVAHLLGREEGSRELLSRGYRDAIRAGLHGRAARFAFWVAHSLMFESRTGEASGWIARARQLVAGQDRDCVEQGYLLMWSGLEQLQAGEFATALATLAEAEGIAARYGDPTLGAGVRYLRGRAYIWSGRVADGMQVLDEVMVSVTAGEVSPLNIGHTYCGVLEACHEVLDLRRAQEWTGALGRWCESQPDLVPYRGPCQVYRAEVMQFHGAWADAFAEAQRACAWLSQPASPEGPADAFYRVGELHRLRGEYTAAEEAYRQASRLGRRPEPGLPLLWLAQGRIEAARTALNRALAEETGLGQRAELLDAAIQALLATGDVAGARSHAGELREIAAALGAPLVRARCLMAEGAAALAARQPDAALGPLRHAWLEWQRLEAPYDAARARLLIGCAYRALGDDDTAVMEFDAARWVFQQLGALPDLARVEAFAAPAGAKQTPGGLTLRELDVLRLIAAGQTNKEIAAALVISEHTVARHVQNMLARLGCASRAALAAFAAEHGLVRPRHSQS